MKKMSIYIDKIFPNIKTGLCNVGFLLGAGTSKGAGYPIGKDLTKLVIEKLGQQEKNIIEKLLKDKNITYNFKEGIPDIEILADMILKERTTIQSDNLLKIENLIRKDIIEVFAEIKVPILTSHIKFLSLIKKLCQNRAVSVWLFTTNYDLLLELAAMQVKVPIYNGFEGIFARYFDIDKIDLVHGTKKIFFYEYKEPIIKLIKLHGSISWYKKNNEIYEISNNYPRKEDFERIMILPNIEKTFECMENPYDKLFRYANQIIGNQCKYLVSCGYSFRDRHINEQLIIPKLKEGKIRLFSLSQDLSPEMEIFKSYNTFNYLTKSEQYIDKAITKEESDLWKFDKFIEFVDNQS